jgi:hypothetical protein
VPQKFAISDMAGMSYENQTLNFTSSDEELAHEFRFFFVKKSEEMSKEMHIAYEVR